MMPASPEAAMPSQRKRSAATSMIRRRDTSFRPFSYRMACLFIIRLANYIMIIISSYDYNSMGVLEHQMDANSGKTAIVTGASTGIGRASAEALARAGFTVFGTSRRTTGNGSNRVSMLTCNVTDDAAVDALVSTVLAQ